MRWVSWLTAGWKMFAALPGHWLLMGLTWFASLALVVMLLSPIPVIGPVPGPVLLVLLTAGMLSAARRQAERGEIELGLIFDGFRQHLGNLALVGVFFSLPLVFWSLLVAIAISASLLAGAIGGIAGGWLAGLVATLHTLLSGLLTASVLYLLAWGVMVLSLWFAPALIMYGNCAPFDAMRLSLRASVRNFVCTLCLGLAIYLGWLLALLTAGIGILVLVPVIVGSLRAAYLDVFEPSPSPAEPTTRMWEAD